MKKADEMNAIEILTEVAEAEETSCQDRARLADLSLRLVHLTGKTPATLLTELGM